MSEETTTTTEAPAAPAELAAPVETTPAPATPPEPVAITTENAPEILETLDPAARRAILFGEKPPAVQPPEQKPGPAKIESGPVAAATPPVEPVPPELVEDDEKITKNFRLHTEDPKQSAFLKALSAAMRVNPTVNPVDVARTVGYELPAGDGPALETVPGLEPEPAGPAPGSLQAQIAELEEQVAAKSDELISPEYTKLVTDLATLRMRAEMQADKAHTARVSAREANKAATLVDYPTANDGESLLGAEIERQYAAIQRDPQHPDRARVAGDDFPAWLTQKAATAVAARLQKTLGFTEAQALAAVKGQPTTEAKGPAVKAAPTNPQAAPVPRHILVTAPGGRPAPEPVTLDAAQILERAGTDPKFRREALFGGEKGWSVG